MVFSGVVSGKNLLIGGIGQSADNQQTNRNWADQFTQNGLGETEYVPTYSKGGFEGVNDVPDVSKATPKYTVYKDSSTGAITPVPGTASYTPDDNNGLTSDLLGYNQHETIHYDTIYAHSGGARTAVTALLYQHVTADTLVLIAPAMGPMEKEVYDWEIQQLLDSGIVNKIVVYQSAAEQRGDAIHWPLPFSNFWEGTFSLGEIKGNFEIKTLSQEQLAGKVGIDAHKQMWNAALNLELGRDPLSSAPEAVNGMRPIPLSGTKFPSDYCSMWKSTYQNDADWVAKGTKKMGRGMTEEEIRQEAERSAYARNWGTGGDVSGRATGIINNWFANGAPGLS
jgi:hypothetical protein